MKALSKFVLLFVFVVMLFSCGGNDPGEQRSEQKRSDKRGVSFDFAYTEDVTLLAPGVSWSYNWNTDQSLYIDDEARNNDVSYCPMVWGGATGYEENIRNYKKKNPKCEYLLAFNEPNLNDQSKMTPAEAAKHWPKLKALAKELNMKIISPAMNWGTLSGYNNPIKWLDEFFDQPEVSLDDVHGIAIHCYMTNGQATKGYIEMYKKYKKPLWMTEFCAWDGPVTAKSQMEYMCDIVNYMECDPDVFRYAWFIPRRDDADTNAFPYMALLTKGSYPTGLTALGKVYINLSTMDKKVYYTKGQIIEAEHYTGINTSECVGVSGWTSGPTAQPTTDASGGVLELVDFKGGQWVEYQLEMTEAKNYSLSIRYTAAADASMEVLLNEQSVQTLTLPGTNKSWTTVSESVRLSKGKQTLRLRTMSGSVNINWLKID